MIIAEEYYEEQAILNATKWFIKKFNIGKILKKSNAYKSKGIPVIRIFIYLLELVFSKKSMYMNILNGTHKAGFQKVWAVVGFRLICPFALESAFSFIPFEAQQIFDTRLLDENITFPATMGTVNQAIGDIANGGLGILYITTGQETDGTRIITQALHHEYWLLFFSKIWFPGVLLILLYGIVSYVLLKRRMRTAIRVEGNLYETDNIQSPFVLGIIKPKIYLPLSLAAGEREYIILHEQTHIRRRDHIIKFAAYFILCLHWFNPLAWAAFLLMGVDMDAYVKHKLKKCSLNFVNILRTTFGQDKSTAKLFLSSVVLL